MVEENFENTYLKMVQNGPQLFYVIISFTFRVFSKTCYCQLKWVAPECWWQELSAHLDHFLGAHQHLEIRQWRNVYDAQM